MMRGWSRVDVDEEDRGTIYDSDVIRRLFGYLTPYWRVLTLTILAMLVYTATIIAIPWIVKLTIDNHVRTSDISGLNLVVLAFLIVALVQFGSNYFHLKLMSKVSQQVLYKLRVDLFSHTHRLSMSYFEKHEVGKTMSRIQNDVQHLQEFISIMVLSLADVLSLAGIVVAMVIMNVELAAITFSVIPLLFLMLLIWQKFARLAFIRVRQKLAVVNSELQENITGVRVVQSMNREHSNIRQFGKTNNSHLDATLKSSRYSSFLFPSVEVVSALGLGLVVLFGGSMVINGELEPGVLVAFALYIQRFFDPVRNLTMQYGDLQRAMASGVRIFELLDQRPDIVDKPNSNLLENLKGEICYEGVDFEYEQGQPVLQDVNVHVKPGETIALVGPTGAGKTSFVSLLLRLYDVTSGCIKVDGQDVRDITRLSLVRDMSIVTQEPFLFSGTIKENIRYDQRNVTDSDVESAAKAVQAHEFITKLPLSYETQLLERGSNLSIGQRQLVSFARALVGNPRILVLDEATANIDTDTEILIQRSLKKLLSDRTAIVIAHRLSTIKSADRILVLDKGRIVDQGNHDQLLQRGGLYADLQSFTAGQ